jgi:hypothetical protein
MLFPNPNMHVIYVIILIGNIYLILLKINLNQNDFQIIKIF